MTDSYLPVEGQVFVFQLQSQTAFFSVFPSQENGGAHTVVYAAPAASAQYRHNIQSGAVDSVALYEVLSTG